MKTKRYATSRQTVCQQCSTAKARCDRKAQCCSRCARRGLACKYYKSTSITQSPTSGNNADGDAKTQDHEFEPDHHDETVFLDQDPEFEVFPAQSLDHDKPLNASLRDSGSIVNESLITSATTIHTNSRSLDFTCLGLICPIDADSISNRWLNAFVPLPNQKIKQYPASVTAFVYRLLKSYAAVAVRGGVVPPFVHFSQVEFFSTSQSLTTCLSLIRICDKALPGSQEVAANVLQQEMTKIHETYATFEDVVLVGAFQAYLIYSLVLYFSLAQGSNPFLRQAMMNLQELACASSKRGLLCVEEPQHSRPRWEAWIVAEANRRTLYTMYLFDSLLSVQDGLPTFLGTELQGLPAPAGRPLWHARTRQDWATAYNMYLAAWRDPALCIDELWPMPDTFSPPDIEARRERVDQWLEQVDEFGTMLYAVTCCTHEGRW